MFCPKENSYLQLVCPIEPRLINKVVRRTMRKKVTSLREIDENADITIKSAAKKLESTQPFLSLVGVDVTQARLGFGNTGLQIIGRELNSNNKMVKLRAIHTLLDQVLIPGTIWFLIKTNVVYRLIDLMTDNDPIVREKVITIVTRIATHTLGGNKIMTRPIVIDHLINLFMQDRKEIRYAASLCLKTLTRYRCVCEVISRNENIIVSLLKMIKHDYMEIVLYHLNSLKNLSEWDPVKPLKANAFQVLRKLLVYHQYRVVQSAMDCMTQLCKHSVGKKLADKYDMNQLLLHYLLSPDIEVIVSTLGLMEYTTLTTQSKWRTKQFALDLIKRLVALSVAHNIPVIQIRAMQVMINLCDCGDMRAEIKNNWKKVISRSVKISTNERWEGTTDMTTYCLETGYNYKTMCIEDVKTIREDYGDTVIPFDVNSYASRIRATKKRLIKTINSEKYEY